LSKGEDRLAAAVCRIAGHVPLVDGNSVADALRRVATRLRQIATDDGVLWRAVRWATLNWVLDMASLWVFLAAFGYRTSPDALIISYGPPHRPRPVPLHPGGPRLGGAAFA